MAAPTAADHGDYSDFFESLFGSGFGANQRSAGSRQRHSKGEDSQAKITIDLQDSYTGATRNITMREQVAGPHGQMQAKNRTLKINIPKGIKAGQKIRLQKQGEPGFSGGENGDLYIEVGFNPNPIYSIDGSDITTELTISPWQAALGDKVQVPTPTGTVDLTLPKLTSSGSKMRLKGRGLPGKVPGDFFVKLKIAFPTGLSDEEQALYQQLKAIAESRKL